jgi:hypothetical protein
MAIYQMTADMLQRVPETSFENEGVYERKDLQRLLRAQIDVIEPRLLVIAEEFGEWVDSSRRIDLLCLDSEARLVVVELKRTEDGGHMDLQALRYAAMVSAMTFGQLVDAYLRTHRQDSLDFESAQAKILEFLDWDEVYEDDFPSDVRIILAAAEFSKELTTTAIWLNERGLDVRCVRLRPHRLPDGNLLVDVQQLIPLPEATAFQTQIGQKKQAERQSKSERHGLRLRFWEQLLPLASTRTDIHANRRPGGDSWIGSGIGRAGFQLVYAIRKLDCQVELWISLGSGRAEANLKAFIALAEQKEAIEAEFGALLDWQELPGKDSCRVRKVISGGYGSPIEDWTSVQETLVDSMIRLDRALRKRVAALAV